MEGGHQGSVERPNKGQDMPAVFAAEDPELVLQRDDRSVGVEHLRRVAVGRRVIGVDDDADLWRVGQVGFVHVERRHVGRDAASRVAFEACVAGCLAHAGQQVARERGDATVARHICRYEAGLQGPVAEGGVPEKADDPVETG